MNEDGEAVRVKYDAQTRRAELFYGDRRVLLPRYYNTDEEAQTAAEKYAVRYLGKIRGR